jgi:hypothetical protein
MQRQETIFWSDAITGTDGVTRAATFSPDRRYRYMLSRHWDSGDKVCVFVGLNPSKADEYVDDPTIRRCIRFTQDWGMNHLVMLNLFALRSTDPEILRHSQDPVGPLNDEIIAKLSKSADLTVACWGNGGVLKGRSRQVLALLKKPHHMGITSIAEPKHPLYLRADTVLRQW